MKQTFRVGGQEITVKENLLDRAIRTIDPIRAARRFRSRMALALTGAYTGARRDRRQTAGWKTSGGDPDSDILFDLPTLRERSRDHIRNNPIAGGAVNTTVTNVVGTGLRLNAVLDREVLNMTDDQADAWEAQTERLWRLWAESQECDAARTLNFAAIQDLVFRQSLENGDVFTLLPRITRKGSPFDLKLQVVEADRVCNKDNVKDSPTLAGGVQKDSNGAPVAYHILKAHPGNMFGAAKEWIEVPAFGAQTGLRNVLHLYKMLRPGQSRGVPFVAPVIEALKQLGQYTEAELMATVISSYLTVFVKTEAGDSTLDNVTQMGGETGAKATDQDLKLGQGTIVGLAEGEDIETVNPGRPNPNFDPFFMAIVRQIGIALEIPYEILIKHFTASYTAAQAAMLEAWKFFSVRRQWLADNFCQMVYEVWMWEQVAEGRIAAPGFFNDALIRKAYLSAEWNGPSRGMIREDIELKSVRDRLELTLSTRAREAARLTGSDWTQDILPQAIKERKKLEAAGLPTGDKNPAPVQPQQTDPNQPDQQDQNTQQEEP